MHIRFPHTISNGEFSPALLAMDPLFWNIKSHFEYTWFWALAISVVPGKRWTFAIVWDSRRFLDFKWMYSEPHLQSVVEKERDFESVYPGDAGWWEMRLE